MLLYTVLDVLPVAGPSHADRSAAETSSAKVRTFIFLHHPLPVSLDRAHSRTQYGGIALLLLARTTSSKTCRSRGVNVAIRKEYHLPRLLLFKHRVVMREGPFDSFKKLLRCYRLGQKLLPTGLDGPHSGGNVRIPR
jgi:hypothetical protein